ncbi:MAG: PAS domain S-box protein [Thermoanaerobaculaceae bacterium]|nr:PAS domain S-box protein [Thermoanaerobaculaceae bacterium]
MTLYILVDIDKIKIEEFYEWKRKMNGMGYLFFGISFALVLLLFASLFAIFLLSEKRKSNLVLISSIMFFAVLNLFSHFIVQDKENISYQKTLLILSISIISIFIVFLIVVIFVGGRKDILSSFGKSIFTAERMLEEIPVAVRLLKKDDMSILYANRKTEELFGYKKDELIGMPLHFLYSSECGDKMDYIEGIRKDLLEKGIWQGEILHIKKNNSTFWGMAFTCTVFHPKYGECFMTWEVDISDWRYSEKMISVFEKILNDVASGILLAKEGNIIYANQRLCNLYDSQKSELIGAPFSLLFSEQSSNSEYLMEKLERQLSEKGEFHEEFFHKKNDGSVLWTEVSVSRVENPKLGDCLVGIFTDITKIKEMEKAAKNAQEQYSMIANNISDVIWSFDIEENRYNYLSASVEKLFGYKPEEMLNMSIFDNLAEEYISYADENLRRRKQSFLMDKSFSSFHSDFVDLKRKDGRIFNAEVKTRFISGEDGKIYLIGLTRDITKEKEMIDKLTILKRAVDNALESIFIMDCNLLVTYVNSKFSEITGYSKEEAIGSFSKILRIKENDFEYENLWNEVKKTGSYSGIIRCKKKDGTLFFAQTNVSTIRDDRGDVIGYVAVQNDITKQKELEEMVKNKEKMAIIGQFAGAIAHEIKNPLFSITGGLQILQLSENLTREEKEDLEVLYKECMRIDRLIKQLKIHSTPQSSVFENIDISSLLVEMKSLMKSSLVEKNIELIIRCDRHLPFLKASRDGMEQLLLNLVINAVESLEKDGIIEIDCWLEDKFLHLTVEDNGKGIKPEHIPHLFDPLFSTKSGNSGLGLFVCKRIVVEHKGEIFVSSSKAGKGACFEIILPLNGENYA